MLKKGCRKVAFFIEKFAAVLVALTCQVIR